MSTAARQSGARPDPQTFRLPRSAYLVVVILLFCTAPLAMAGGQTHGVSSGANGPGQPPTWEFVTDTPFGPRLLLLLIPLAAAVFVLRCRTRVDSDGIRVRALLGERRLPWAQLRGLSVSERSVYAVCVDGSVRLPCVRVGNLHALAAASGGRLPELPAATPKYAPSGRGRGR